MLTEQTARQVAEEAAAVQPINLLPLPDECRRRTPHAPLIVGEEKVVTLGRERDQLDNANDEKIRCAEFAERQRVGLLTGE